MAKRALYLLREWLIEPKFDRTLSFVHDLAAVELGETYRYSQRDGQIVWTSRPISSCTESLAGTGTGLPSLSDAVTKICAPGPWAVAPEI